MTVLIIGAVVVGMAAGRLIVPQAFGLYTSTITSVGLCLILFLVGVDMGRQGGVLQEIKEAGLRVLLIPFAVVVGTLGGAAVAGCILPLTIQDTLAASAGFGWYSLAPMLLAEYSPTISAIAFLSNVMREVSAIILIPIVAKRIGFLECVSLPGAAAMDTLLPVVVSATHQRIAIYSLTSGVILSILVPIVIPLIVGL